MTSASRTIVSRVTGLRGDELARVGPLAGAYGLVMAALYVLKPTRNAVFLDRFGVDELPYALLMVAAVGAVTVTVYGRLGRVMRFDRLTLTMFAIFIGCLGGFRLLFVLGQSWVFYFFYVWVALFGLVATSLVWQLANAEFNAREARRLFGLVGTGGIAGAIAGGFFTSWAATALGTDNLVLVAMALLFAALMFLRAATTTRALKKQRYEERGGGLDAIAKSRLLRLVTLMVALIAVVAVIVDVQFNDIVERNFPLRDDKTAFFGRFFAYLNLFGIMVQIFVTPRILTHLGVGAGLMLLPLALGLGTGALVLLPALWTGLLPKLADGGFRHSVHKAAFEILFIPLPAALKKRSKLFLDASVDSFATGAGALLVLLLTSQFGMSYRGLGLVSIGLIVAWALVAFRVRVAYVDAFRQALAKRQLDLTDVRVNISEASTVDTLLNVLDGSAERPLQFALDTLVTVEDERLEARVAPLLRHERAGVRRRALRVLHNQRGGRVDDVRALLDDADHGVRVEAVHYLVLHSAGEPLERLAEFLRADSIKIRAAALGAIAEYGAERERALVDSALIDALLAIEGREGELARVHIVKLLGELRSPELQRYWLTFMNDASERVVRQTIQSAGESQISALADWLFQLLDDTRYRMDARIALAAYGEDVLDEIDARMSDTSLSNRVRRTLPRILARIPSNRSVELLFEHLQSADRSLRRAMIGALEKLRNRFPGLRFPDPDIGRLLDAEIREYYAHHRAASVLEAPGRGAAGGLLDRTIREKQQDNLHHIFQLLALRYPSKDMATAYAGLNSSDPSVKASALEFLDNVLERHLKERLLPIVDPDQSDRVGEVSRLVLGRALREREDAIALLLQSDDPWIRAATLYSLLDESSQSVPGWVEAAGRDPDAVVRETATLVGRRVAST